ncbi:hypothetical protein PCANC_03938 [Puccinia coronata f. sp. avenae]|uniref:Reverse transcriptase Ty1/copia-type domain-containing protein n=1 Tax=Puccinia coronata f. sp. avenae TaxID=200324 RepID=A0A2N5W183_9BASI|nr:hypothetical protein PCANC_03938 [Puccinia coronata f. sp. avenae]
MDTDAPALSTTKSEYRACSECGQDIIWTQQLLDSLRPSIPLPPSNVTLHCDNQGALALLKETVYQHRTRHINVRFHWLRHHIAESDDFHLSYIPTDNNVADFLTKPLTPIKTKQALSNVQVPSIRSLRSLISETPSSCSQLPIWCFSGTSPFYSLSSLAHLGDSLLVLTAAHLVFLRYKSLLFALFARSSRRLSPRAHSCPSGVSQQDLLAESSREAGPARREFSGSRTCSPRVLGKQDLLAESSREAGPARREFSGSRTCSPRVLGKQDLLAKSSREAGPARQEFSGSRTCSPRALGKQVAPASRESSANSYLLPETSRRAGSYLLPETSRRAGGYLLPETSRRADGYLLPKSSRRAGGYLLPKSSRRAGGYLFPKSSRRALPAYLFAESSQEAASYLLAQSSWEADGYLLPKSSLEAVSYQLAKSS